MREFVFFLLGTMLGGLTGITMMCMLQINRLKDNTAEKDKSSNHEEEC